jgi:DNA-3-methyladenine glycosylase II
MTRQLIIQTDSPEVQTLSRNDPLLGRLITAIGDLTLDLRDDDFGSLVRSVIGQQLSVKAAATIWNRTVDLCGVITPDAILSTSDERLRTAGLSKAKIAYVKDLSSKVGNGQLELSRLREQADEDVIRSLRQVKGVGQWTAEMFLVFSLGRLDILSLGDAGLQRAANWLYGQQSAGKKIELVGLGDNWSPYRTLASLYLWEAINRGYVDGYAELPLNEER